MDSDGGLQGKKDFFFEKKKQKTFTHGGGQTVQIGKSRAARNRKKFFGSFLQKRTAFFLAFLNKNNLLTNKKAE